MRFMERLKQNLFVIFQLSNLWILKPVRYSPFEMIQEVINRSDIIDVAHCSCRVTSRLIGKGCNHKLENCIKYDELAEYLIDKKIGRKISKEEALEIVRDSEKGRTCSSRR